VKQKKRLMVIKLHLSYDTFFLKVELVNIQCKHFTNQRTLVILGRHCEQFLKCQS